MSEITLTIPSQDTSFIITIIVSVVLLGAAHLIKAIKGGSGKDLFNFKRDYKEATKKLNTGQKNNTESTFIGRAYRKQIYISNNAKHIFVCGTTGSGKTVALSNFIKSGLTYNYPILIVDGKGDNGAGSLLDIVNQLKGNRKVYVINLSEPETSDKYNPFKNTNPDIIKDMLINMTDWSEEHYKYNTERYVQRLCSLLELSEITISFDSLIKYLSVYNFISLSKRLTEKGIITKEEHLENMEITKTSGKIAESAAARFSTIKESKLGKIFDDNGIDIYSALEQNAIILFILNPLLYPEMSPLFGKLIVIDSKKAVSKFYKHKKDRIFYILDEINTYASSNLIDLVNKSRSANITCILATQSLSDLNIISEHFKEQVIENCNNYIVLRQNSSTNAENWSNVLGTKKTMEATYQIKDNQETNLGTLKRTREYIYHPDDIKQLRTGNAIYLSRDEMFHSKIEINKSF